jgi:hypothetical protein
LSRQGPPGTTETLRCLPYSAQRSLRGTPTYSRCPPRLFIVLDLPTSIRYGYTMSDEPNLVLEHLRAIREEQAVLSSKLGAVADSMVSMRKDIYSLEKRIDGMEKQAANLTDAVNGLRADMRMIAVAVDQHSARLDKIEVRLGLHPSD